MQNHSSIFRPEAVRHYFHQRERAVFPVYATTRTALCAALLSIILAAGVLLAAWLRVPVYARGVAVPIEPEERTSSETIEMALFVPAESLSKLAAGQKVFLRDGPTGWRVGGRIKTFGLGITPSPDALARFRLAALADGVSQDPAAIALVGPLPSNLATRNTRDDVLEISIEIGERRLLFPGAAGH